MVYTGKFVEAGALSLDTTVIVFANYTKSINVTNSLNPQREVKLSKTHILQFLVIKTFQIELPLLSSSLFRLVELKHIFR